MGKNSSYIRNVAKAALRGVNAESIIDVESKLVGRKFWTYEDAERAVTNAGLVVDDVKSNVSEIVAFDWEGNGFALLLRRQSSMYGEYGCFEITGVIHC